MHNIIGDTVRGTLYSWSVDPDSWSKLAWFYGILFVYVGYKILKSFKETAQELSESKEARDEALGGLAEWIIAVIPLATILFVVWYFELWKH